MISAGTRPTGVGQRGDRRGAGDFGLGDFVWSSGADGRALGNDGGFLIPGREDFLGGQRLCIRSAEGGVSPHDGGANGKFDHASRFTCA